MRQLLLRATSAAVASALLCSCKVGPDYHRPAFETAPDYKESTDWKPSEPNDILSRGPWWTIYNDDVLNGLEDQVNISNENIKAAAAAFEQSRALVAQARAGLWPTIAALFQVTRAQSAPFPQSTTYNAGLTGTWNLDIWGGIRRNVESDRDSAQAANASLAAARLSAQGQLAISYFELRAQDQNQVLLDNTVDAETQSLKITESRYKFGVAARADVVSAEAQLLSSQAQQVNNKIQRAVLEHAIAVLIGQQPAVFSLAVAPIRTDVPTVPAGIPSTLLERRPDVAQAERRVAAANAQIGVAKAAYFPTVQLGGGGNFEGSGVSHLFSASNRIWSFGPELAETLFDAGLRRAQVAQARAAYDATVDTYRQTVLTSFEQVEDDIVTLKVLEEQSGIEEKAVKAAREAEALTLNQYKAGTVPYSSVITAQTTRFAQEETALAVLSSRLQGSVNLIEALGGGWDQSQATDK